METEAALSAFWALSQGTRFEAFRLLIRHEPDGLAAGELAKLLSVAPNNLSAHFNVLSRAELITTERRGRSIIYRARIDRLEMLLLFLLKDCCNERPDVRARVMKSVTRQLSAKARGR
jgi:ArsR family transcriptional regulator, arsenate/arsenite/antimonite-responsive transcriptional repressor